MSDMHEIFGEVIHSYSRAQAIEDGVLVDVTETAKEAGFKYPVALTRTAYEDCVAWTEADSRRQTHQDESGRLWDVVWMTKVAIARTGRGSDRIDVVLHRIPRGGRGTKPRVVQLVAVCSPGDDAEPVITIMFPGED